MYIYIYIELKKACARKRWKERCGLACGKPHSGSAAASGPQVGWERPLD